MATTTKSIEQKKVVLSVHLNVFRVYEHQNGFGGFGKKKEIAHKK